MARTLANSLVTDTVAAQALEDGNVRLLGKDDNGLVTEFRVTKGDAIELMAWLSEVTS